MSSLPLLNIANTILDVVNTTNDIILNTDSLLSSRAANNHNHDDSYYTIVETNALISNFNPTHNHQVEDISDASVLGKQILKANTIGNVKSILNLTKADFGRSNLDNTSDFDKPVSTLQQAALNLKANNISPTFTGIPTVPTANTATNNNQIASTKFAKDVFANEGINRMAANSDIWSGVATDKYLSPQNIPSSMVPVEITNTGYVWTARTAPEANTWSSVCYGTPDGNGLFVAVANSGTNRVMTSPDGITWTARSAPLAQWQSVCYGNGLFVAVSYDGTNRVMTSPDGITWTARTHAQDNTWMSVCYGSPGGTSLFVAVAHSGTNRVMTSPDGITWTARTTPINTWYSVCYGNGTFVAVAGNDPERVMTSPDGITWTARQGMRRFAWRSVCYGNGLFVAVALTGQATASPDGITWTIRETPTPSVWISVCYGTPNGNPLFVAVANSGNITIMTSPDGITWTSTANTTAANINSVCFGEPNGNPLFAALSGASNILSSPAAEFGKLNLNNGKIFKITLTNDIHLSFNVNTPGKSGLIIINTGTGNKKLTTNATWKFGSQKTISQTPNTIDVISYYIEDSNTITATLTKAYN